MLGREGSCRKFYRVSYSRQQGKSTDKPRSDRAQPNAEEELCPSRLFCACVCVCVCVRVCVCVCVCVSVCEHTGHVIIWLSRLLLPPRQQKRPSGGQWRRRCGCARSGAVPYLLLFFFDATGSLCWASRNWKQERDAGLKGARPESTTTTDWHKKKIDKRSTMLSSLLFPPREERRHRAGMPILIAAQKSNDIQRNHGI